MMEVIAGIAVLFSVLVPDRIWVGPGQPMLVTNRHDAAVTLVLTDFTGNAIEPRRPPQVEAGQKADVREMFREVSLAGAYVLYAVPIGSALSEFVGTPLVLSVRSDKRPGAPMEPMVTRIEPLRFARLATDRGEMTMAFYYDAAPHTVTTFLELAAEGFYNGLAFHRILPGFVLQGGDPRGTGTGGPGFQIDAEFSDRKHEEGVLSMARNGDPLEQQGLKPRCEFANSAGSQFFICLAYQQNLDSRYTAFGRVTEGMETVKAIAAVPLADPAQGRPQEPPVIQKIAVRAVTPETNPYPAIMPNFKADFVPREQQR